MFERRTPERLNVGRRDLALGVVPSIVVVGAMFVIYAAVGVAVAADESLATDGATFGLVALVAILAVPHFVVGSIVGFWSGVTPPWAVQMALAPLVLLVVALAVTGGPVLSLVAGGGLTLAAVLGWIVLSLGGMVVGERFASRFSLGRADLPV